MVKDNRKKQLAGIHSLNRIHLSAHWCSCSASQEIPPYSFLGTPRRKRVAGVNAVFRQVSGRVQCTPPPHWAIFRHSLTEAVTYTMFRPDPGGDVRVLEILGRGMSELPAADFWRISILEPRATSPSPLVRSNIKIQIQSFWQNSPCGSWFTKEPSGTPAFYRSLDEYRYKEHWRLESAVGFEKNTGLWALEIGCGCGSDAERFARAGAHYLAVDLTNAAVSITQRRFQLAKLGGRFVQGDAENLPFAAGSFDFVYSHGVLHHTPDTPRAIGEVHRVLCPGGRAVIMLYCRNSFNYRVNLRLVRRLRVCLPRTNLGIGIKLARKIGHERMENLQRHQELIQQDPDSCLDMQHMLNRNTDGPR